MKGQDIKSLEDENLERSTNSSSSSSDDDDSKYVDALDVSFETLLQEINKDFPDVNVFKKIFEDVGWFRGCILTIYHMLDRAEFATPKGELRNLITKIKIRVYEVWEKETVIHEVKEAENSTLLATIICRKPQQQLETTDDASIATKRQAIVNLITSLTSYEGNYEITPKILLDHLLVQVGNDSKEEEEIFSKVIADLEKFDDTFLIQSLRNERFWPTIRTYEGRLAVRYILCKALNKDPEQGLEELSRAFSAANSYYRWNNTKIGKKANIVTHLLLEIQRSILLGYPLSLQREAAEMGRMSKYEADYREIEIAANLLKALSVVLNELCPTAKKDIEFLDGVLSKWEKGGYLESLKKVSRAPRFDANVPTREYSVWVKKLQSDDLQEGQKKLQSDDLQDDSKFWQLGKKAIIALGGISITAIVGYFLNKAGILKNISKNLANISFSSNIFSWGRVVAEESKSL